MPLVTKRVLVGCDGSSEARDAVALGALLASLDGSELRLVGVYPTATFPVPPPFAAADLAAQADAVLRRERDALAPQATVEAVIDISAPRALHRCAVRHRADVVVIGSGRLAPPGHVAISRRGRQLLGEAPFAIAIAARGWHEQSPQLKRIGVGDDGSAEAREAVAFAARLACASGGRLHLRRVVDDRLPALVDESLPRADLQQAFEHERGRAQAEASALGADAKVSVTVGDPGYELRDLSEVVDLLIVGSRGWGPAGRVVNGSVGETLIADAACSLILVPRSLRG